MKGAKTPEESTPPSPGHEREWHDSIKSRRQPSANVSYEDLHKIGGCVLCDGGSLICYLGQYQLPEVLDLMHAHLRFWWLEAAEQQVPVWFTAQQLLDAQILPVSTVRRVISVER